MNNGFKSFIIIVIVAAVAAAGIYFAKSKSTKNDSPTNQTAQSTTPETKTIEQPSLPDTPLVTEAIFFYGSTCPHCKKVEQFFSDYQMNKRVKFEQKEVYSDKNNAQLMTEKQALCKGLSEDDKGGVPFLYAPNKCLVGDQPIIDYFKQLAGIS